MWHLPLNLSLHLPPIIKKVNHERSVHCRHFTQTDWGNIKNYDLCISPDYCRSVPEENASLIVFLFQRNSFNRVLIRFFPYTAQTRHFASLFYQGLQFLHGSYPSAITSSRVPVNSCRFAAFIWVTDVQLGR